MNSHVMSNAAVGLCETDFQIQVPSESSKILEQQLELNGCSSIFEDSEGT